MPKTSENKKKCQRLAHDPVNASGGEEAGRRQLVLDGGSGLFRTEMCPCFDRVSGDPMSPSWITDVGHCREMEWPGKAEEQLRKHRKFQSWKTGFQRRPKREMLRLDNKIQFDGEPGCQQGFRCCKGFLPSGSDILRCVDITKYVANHCRHFAPP